MDTSKKRYVFHNEFFKIFFIAHPERDCGLEMLGGWTLLAYRLIRAGDVVVESCIQVVACDRFCKELNRVPVAAGRLIDDPEKI
jgi:hypothetical protein